MAAALFAAALMPSPPQAPSGQAASGQAASGPAASGQAASKTATSEALPIIDIAALPADAAEAVGAAYADAKRQPGSAAAVGHLAVVLHAWEEWEPALGAYRAAQALAPRDHRWWHLAGLLETRRGRHHEALALFERAAALAPQEDAVTLRLAEARLEAGDVERSAALYAGLVANPRTAAAAEYGLGRIAMERGDHAGALRHFDRAVEIFPDFGAAHYGRALAYRRLGRAGEAAAALERQKRCVACWPATGDTLAEWVTSVRDDAAAVLKRGVALARDGEDRKAIEAHERALALDPALAQARVNLITLYGRTGDAERARAEYERTLALGTNLAEAHANYAQVLLAEKRAGEAAALFRKALELTPADPQAWHGLGLALETGGDVAAASAAYREASTHAPAFRMARFNYARTLVHAGRLPEAIAELEKLRTPEDEETPRYRFALSAALVRSGDVARGRAEAQAALELARRYEQKELAATIERDLGSLK